MKLEMIGKGKDKWIVNVNGRDEAFELETRGQVYAFIRAARILEIEDAQLTISRTLEAEYGCNVDSVERSSGF